MQRSTQIRYSTVSHLVAKPQQQQQRTWMLRERQRVSTWRRSKQASKQTWKGWEWGCHNKLANFTNVRVAFHYLNFCSESFHGARSRSNTTQLQLVYSCYEPLETAIHHLHIRTAGKGLNVRIWTVFFMKIPSAPQLLIIQMNTNPV